MKTLVKNNARTNVKTTEKATVTTGVKTSPVNRTDSNSQQVALAAMCGQYLFPGRVNLYVHEVATALQIAENQVIDLIDSGSIAAINIASDVREGGASRSGRAPRKYWRIPVCAFDAFVSARHNL